MISRLHSMHFDPQSNFVSDGPDGGSPSSGAGLLPRRGLRGQVVVFAAAVAGVLAVWIWQQSNTPASASGAAKEPPHQHRPGSAPPITAEERDQSDGSRPTPATDTAPPGDDAQPTRSPSADRHQRSSPLEFHYTAQPSEAQLQRAAELLAQGKRALAMRQSDKAIGSLREAVQLDPGSADARYNLGLAYVLADDHQSARQQHRKLQALDPSLASLLDNLIQ